MKKIILLLAVCTAFFNVSAQIATPAASPTATISQQVGLGKVSISYSRPSLKGRTMLGAANVPFGKLWRTGANKITAIEFSEDMSIAGKAIAKGKYALVTIPDAAEWTVILNKDTEQWGVYEFKEANDVLRFKVKATKNKVKTETLTFDFADTKSNSATMTLAWENAQIAFEVKHDPDAQIMADIKAKMSAAEIKNDTYYDAADYYYTTNRDLKQALVWATTMVEKDPQSWTYHLHAKIAAKLGQCDLAIASATKGLAMAEKEKDNAEIMNNKKVLEGCGKK
jgi:hypothetical protein